MTLLPELVEQEVARSGRSLTASRWYLGIDLGTSNSIAAVVDAQALQRGERASAIRMISVRQETEYGEERSPLLPSCVAEVSKGQWRVGMGAKEAIPHGVDRGRRIFYSTKLEMGLGREPYWPYAASPDLDCPYKVAARILATLRAAVADELGPQAVESLVVTVPASFQLAARKDTTRAAELAGLSLSEGALFDEPNAALLDYLFTVAGQGDAPIDLAEPRTILVFDFGGGTCDISIARVHAAAADGRLSIANLAISRFEQLGGDNIDTSIAEQVLLPLFLEQNGLDPYDLTLSTKTKYVIPALASVAEALKLGLCMEYSTQLALRRREAIRRDEIVASQPSLQVKVPERASSGVVAKRSYLLTNPTLTLDQFDAILQPFLDPDALYEKKTTYTSITSILAPVCDALRRAALDREDVDAVLLAGGSSLIPQVQQTLRDYLPNAALLRFPNLEHTQLAVARGAALQSLFLHGLGQSLLKPIAQESIGILTKDERFLELIPAGTELPYPAGGGSIALRDQLFVPEEGMHEMDIVLAADSADKPLGAERLHFPSPPARGEDVVLEWSLDANKILAVSAFLAARPEVHCHLTLENPLCSTGRRSAQQKEILELEQTVAQSAARREPPSKVFSALHHLGWLYLDLGHAERALDWARSALQAAGRPHSQTLRLMGRAYEYLGRVDRAEPRYREAVAADPADDSALFSLSLCLRRQRRLDEALEVVEKALTISPHDGAYMAQRADLLKGLGRASEAQHCYEEAGRLLVESGLVEPHRIYWLCVVAEETHDESLHRAAEQAELRNRRPNTPYDAHKLPQQRDGG